jgi:hypothetical protein
VLFVRDACLRAEGFRDPFKVVKDEENEKALALLPSTLKCEANLILLCGVQCLCVCVWGGGVAL